MKIANIAMAAAALALAGCTTAGTRVTIDTRTGDAQMLECSSRLASKVRIAGVTYGEVDGIKKANVQIESLTRKRLDLQARMVWLDAGGCLVDADGKPFRAIVLDGHDITGFTGMAPNAKCVKARLQLRFADTAE